MLRIGDNDVNIYPLFISNCYLQLSDTRVETAWNVWVPTPAAIVTMYASVTFLMYLMMHSVLLVCCCFS